MINYKFLFLFISLVFCHNTSVKKSYELLLDSTSYNHATTNITNILRNDPIHLSIDEIGELSKFGLEYYDGSIKVLKPTYLDNSYETEHFKFHYTLDGNDAVADIEYVHSMGRIFEQVWNFFIDTLEYTPPPEVDPQNEKLYNIFIERLPSYYFGITYVENYSENNYSCTSFIKMRNNYTSSQFNNKTEIENIKVTAVHEFFHSIQFGYNCNEELWFMEATAVWSEDELYDEINDLYRYIPSWFSNPQKSLSEESNHMYGSFIFFQYIDEHLGGRNTIKRCWENSKELRNDQFNNPIIAIDNALKVENSSIEEAHSRMRVSNIIMTDNSNLDHYNYEEANNYNELIGDQSLETIVFEKGSFDYFQSNISNALSCSYYQIATETPIMIEFESSNEFLKLITIIKLNDEESWDIIDQKNVNIDPNINIEWIKLLVPRGNDNEINSEYLISIKDGENKDFTFYPPFPNPSTLNDVFFKIQIIKSQNFHLKIYDLLGRQILSENFKSTGGEIKKINWNKYNDVGRKVSNGIYFVELKGENKIITHKTLLLNY